MSGRLGVEASRKMVNDFNASCPVGTPVMVKKDSGEMFETKTRSEAFLSGGCVAVIFVDGIAGFYLLGRVSRRDLGIKLTAW